MKYSETVCCCVPVRLGVFIISLIITLFYLSLTVVVFVKKQDLEDWSTTQHDVNTPLTTQAFNGVFYSFSISFIVYTLVSVFGVVSVISQHRRMVRIYHVVNWFFVLLLFTTSVAFWVYFKVKQEVYVNDCQAQQNLQNNATASIYYTQILIPGKQLIAPGSDKSECINFIKSLVIASGVCVFVFNFLQLYWARSIGKYATTLKKHYQHQRLEVKDEDSVESD
ncbi:hypothetical protein RO3G_00776 [Rhizopus delemar RA 99-880]|uniref:MARVEL domain-containing protein n=3 Tax=Rhizopus TaxID=4842 RepID=I1BIP2_RHIO9|nr:hypothetical protein RO3G_00776 [Rhizopus delemar RA 99-880]|eukprot:EIE76072.1 hypothetical protein RO3G_00776 [Rhizopus delemar RA 99-880]